MPQKTEAEALLQTEISKELFDQALERAKRKQNRIYESTNRACVKDEWYLLQLTVEAVRDITFEEYTWALCNMKKERQSKAPTLSTVNHIVAGSQA
ncbi:MULTISPECIES: hypothetical protein [unclassified Bilifractor]|uniref:hypothetical protein n=1 Tax=unclassified Bilifractor TaxID=2815795 RepID=UPI003F8DA306